MKTFEQIGEAHGELVARKNAAYGSSFAKTGEFLRLLYPEGIRPEQYADALLLVRVFDKQMRIATDRDALGESPWSDICGYGILGVHLHQSSASEDSKTWQGSASGPDASNVSPESRPDSAARSVSESTAPNPTRKTGAEPSQPPSPSSAKPESAPAPTATASANAAADDRAESRRRVRDQSLYMWSCRNDRLACAACCGPLLLRRVIHVNHQPFSFCSEDCKVFALHHLNALPEVKS